MSSECGYDRYDEQWNKIVKEREELTERSNFNEEDITVGYVYDWQNVLEQIQKYAKKFDIKYVIIYTNLDAHNINESVAEGAHYYEIDYIKTQDELVKLLVNFQGKMDTAEKDATNIKASIGHLKLKLESSRTELDSKISREHEKLWSSIKRNRSDCEHWNGRGW